MNIPVHRFIFMNEKLQETEEFQTFRSPAKDTQAMASCHNTLWLLKHVPQSSMLLLERHYNRVFHSITILVTFLLQLYFKYIYIQSMNTFLQRE